MVLDHLGFAVADFARSRAFHVGALAPLGIVVVEEGEGWALLGRDGAPALWFGALGEAPPGPFHLAFSARSREQVRGVHSAALAAGGRDNGAPGLRPRYYPAYYAAFAVAPDGHTIEAVCHGPAGPAQQKPGSLG